MYSLVSRHLRPHPRRVLRTSHSCTWPTLGPRSGRSCCTPRLGRKKKSSQHGRKLRRYKRRWKVERLFAWLQNSRRLVVRYEYKDENFVGMAQLGCIVILLRKCL
jgi:transposase